MIDGNASKKFTTFQGSGHLCMKGFKNQLINKRMADHENTVTVSVWELFYLLVTILMRESVSF